ncbi:MAG: hypothetical protein AAGD10_20305 [Myxococcota bacterium]
MADDTSPDGPSVEGLASIPTGSPDSVRSALEHVDDVFTSLESLTRTLSHRPERWHDAQPLIRRLSDELEAALKGLGREVASLHRSTGWVPGEVAKEPDPPSEEEQEAAQVRHQLIADLIEGLEAPVGRGESFSDASHAVQALEAAGDPIRIERIRHLYPSDQQRWLTMLTAWSRSLQERGDLPDALVSRIRRVFHEVAVFSREARPGHINGLALSHEPEFGSWLDDAQKAWATIVEASRPPALLLHRRPKASSASAPEAGEKAKRFAADKAILVVGPPTSEATAHQLQADLDAEHLEWASAEAIPKARKLGARIDDEFDVVVLCPSAMSQNALEHLTATAGEVGVALVFANNGGQPEDVVAALERAADEHEGRVRERLPAAGKR